MRDCAMQNLFLRGGRDICGRLAPVMADLVANAGERSPPEAERLIPSLLLAEAPLDVHDLC